MLVAVRILGLKADPAAWGSGAWIEPEGQRAGI